jgi:hypothetical protein
MIAVLGVLAMVSFVFLQPLMDYMGNDRVASENPVVVETKYGDYTERDLAVIRDTRAMVDTFLQLAINATVQAQVQSQKFDPRMAQQIADSMLTQWRNRLLQRSAQGPEGAAVQTMVLANRARELGMVVGDQTINDLIAEITFDSLSSDDLMKIIGSLDQRQRVSPARLFEAIRTELLASNLSLMFQVSTVDFPPAQKFEFFSHLNRQAKAEVVPLAVADFTSQVANPSDEVLKAFFDKYKDQYPDATSPDPGFKEPPRAAFQYFKADFAKLREEMKSQVTEQEIKDYYEKNKAQFLALDLPEGPADDKPAEEAPAEEKPAEPEAEEPAAKSESEPAETPSEPKTEEPSEPKAEETPKADDAPKAEEAPAEKPEENEQPNPSQGAGRSRGVFRLTSTAAQDEQPAPATSEPAASAEAPASPPASEEKPAESATDPAAETPAEKPAETTEPATAEAAAADTPAEQRYEPLEKVQDQIRDSIASQKAAERIGVIFDELQAEMRRYSDDMLEYETRDEKDTSIKAPAPFPFAELAKKHGIDAAEVPLVSATDVAGEELGKASNLVRDPRSFSFRSQPFVEIAFNPSLPTFKSTELNDVDGNSYLFWKTKEQAAYVPKFEDVREKVLAAWKMKEARPLARKRAEELAKQADAANKPLKEVFAEQKDLKVIETGAFSWLTRGNVPENPMGGPVRISEIEGLEHTGNGFMEAVFALAAGKSGVAANQPEDTVYVVRVSEFLPEVDQLRDQFAKERPNMYMTVAQGDRYNMYTTWVDNLEKEADVKWVRPADVRTAAAEADADL